MNHGDISHRHALRDGQRRMSEVMRDALRTRTQVIFVREHARLQLVQRGLNTSHIPSSPISFGWPDWFRGCHRPPPCSLGILLGLQATRDRTSGMGRFDPSPPFCLVFTRVTNLQPSRDMSHWGRWTEANRRFIPKTISIRGRIQWWKGNVWMTTSDSGWARWKRVHRCGHHPERRLGLYRRVKSLIAQEVVAALYVAHIPT